MTARPPSPELAHAEADLRRLAATGGYSTVNVVLAELDRLRASLATARDDDKRAMAYVVELERQVERLTAIIRDAADEHKRCPESVRIGEMLEEAVTEEHTAGRPAER